MKRQTDISPFCKTVRIDRRRLRRFIELLDKNLPEEFRAPQGALSVAIFGDAQLAKIHEDFLGDPSETDVITFEGDDDFAGEVCASAERALKCAEKFSNTPSRELSLYVAHGYLHLAGVDDIEPEDAAVMRRAETLALKILDKNFKKPIFYFDV